MSKFWDSKADSPVNFKLALSGNVSVPIIVCSMFTGCVSDFVCQALCVRLCGSDEKALSSMLCNVCFFKAIYLLIHASFYKKPILRNGRLNFSKVKEQPYPN